MAEGGGGASSFYERSSGPVKHPSTFSSGDPGTLDGSFLLQLLQRKSQGTPSSSSHPLLPHEAHRPYDDPAVTAIGPGFPLLPHSLLSHPQTIPAPTQPGLNFGESFSFSPTSWADLRFSPPDVGSRHLQGGPQFFPMDRQGFGFPPSGISPPNSAELNSNYRRISQSSSHDGVLGSNRIGNIGGKKVSGYRDQDERASMRPPPGFGKPIFDGSVEFKRKMEGGASSQIGSNGPNQQWRSHGSHEWRTSDIEEGLNSAIKMMQRSNLQNDRVERHDLKQNPEKILDSDARYRRPNGYTIYKEKHAFSASPVVLNLNNSHSTGEKDDGESDKDLEDNDVDDQGNQTLEEVAHTEIGQFSSRNATCSVEDLLGKHLSEVLSDNLEFTKMIKDINILRGKDFRLDDSRGHRVSSQRIRIRRRELRRRHDINSFTSRFLHIFNSLVPSVVEITKQEQLLLSLKKLVNKEWPDAELHLYGSCANSFGVSNSDIDLCLAINNYEISKLDILLKLAEILESNNLQNVKALTRARVPIVKMKDPVTGLSCDICINNLLAVVNTKLLKDYAQIDERLRQLAFIVKHWAKTRRVNEAYQGTLSSYAYVLMCIHFLQTREPAILPCLQGMTVTRKVVVDDTECAYFDQVEKLQNFGARNKESIAQLIWAFFHYWAYHHDYMKDVISVRTGSIISKHAKDWTRRIGNDRHLICIEDPFEVSHDLGRVVDKFSIKILREEFERAADILQYDPNPAVTLFEPYILASSAESEELASTQA